MTFINREKFVRHDIFGFLRQENTHFVNKFDSAVLWLNMIISDHFLDENGNQKCKKCTEEFRLAVFLPSPSYIKSLEKDLSEYWNVNRVDLSLSHKEYPAKGYIFSAFEPNKIHGYQHHTVWIPYIDRTPDNQLNNFSKGIYNLKMGLRLGKEPRFIVSSKKNV